MVVRANTRTEGIGGHLVHLRQLGRPLRGRLQPLLPGQGRRRARRPGLLPGARLAGHLRPGLRRGPPDEDAARQLPPRGRRATACPSYPHPRLMPDFWEFPTVSMGLGPDQRHLPGARSTATCQPAHSSTPRAVAGVVLRRRRRDRRARVASAALGLAGREHLDNLIFVVNCNLQRLDGPVRGNGKIIQELEAVFRGAGWNVIKVIWGSRWDELLARDVDGVLLDKMNTTVDGEFQKLRHRVGRLHPRALLRPRPPPARAWSRTSATTSCRRLPRGRPRLPQALRRLQGGHRARRARRRPSWPRRSRAGRSAPRSRPATPPTRSRR